MAAACSTLLVSSRLLASCHYTWNSSEGFFDETTITLANVLGFGVGPLDLNC